MDPNAARHLAPFMRRVLRKFGSTKFILFGSRSRDDYLEGSDYDLLVVSPAFEGMPFYARHVLVYALQTSDFDVDIICLSPGEFKRRARDLTVVGVAAREGVEIVA